MDLFCVKCGEPWDMDELHDVEGKSYQEARDEFFQVGCEVFGTTHQMEGGEEAAMVSAALHDILGDDTDAIAAEMQDLGF